jgi:hypothetical protein
MLSISLIYAFLALNYLCFSSLAAPAGPVLDPAPEKFFPLAGSHPFPAPASANMSKISDLFPDRNTTVFSAPSLPTIAGRSNNTLFNQLEVMFCITEFVVGGSGTEGFLINYYDSIVDQRQSVAFKTSGLELYLVHKLLQSHTNKDGFWEDLNVIGSTKGLNVGYHPTGKVLNVAGWTPQVKYDGGHGFEKLQAVCRAIFNIKADGRTGSFYQKYDGEYVPSLLSPQVSLQAGVQPGIPAAVESS